MLNLPSEVKITDVLLVDDHPVVRLGFATLLARLGKKMQFHEAEDCESAVALAAKHAPKVALVDLSLGGVLELNLIKALRAAAPDMGILVVSMHDERLYAERVLRAGARGYVMKQQAAKYIVEAAQTVCSGRVWLSEDMRRLLIEKMVDAPNTEAPKSLDALSNRELEVFRLIGLGLKKADIAVRLNLSPNTVETYRVNLKSKLGVTSGAELHRLAFLHFQNENPLA
jgi:DNA-binding NarL/FixJ family response regulator